MHMGIVRLLHRFLVRQTMPASAVRYYERLIDPIEELYLRPFVDRIAREVGGADRILDVGTGCGHLPLFLGRVLPDARIIGLDLSGACVAAAAEKAKREGLSGRISFLEGGVKHPALSPGAFRLLVSTCSLHHWRWPIRVLGASRRLLAPDGEIWLMDDRGGVPSKDRTAWGRAVESAHGRRLRLFRAVYGMESRFLAYTRAEVEEISRRAGLVVSDWEETGVFFVARLVPAGP